MPTTAPQSLPEITDPARQALNPFGRQGPIVRVEVPPVSTAPDAFSDGIVALMNEPRTPRASPAMRDHLALRTH